MQAVLTVLAAYATNPEEAERLKHLSSLAGKVNYDVLTDHVRKMTFNLLKTFGSTYKSTSVEPLSN